MGVKLVVIKQDHLIDQEVSLNKGVDVVSVVVNKSKLGSYFSHARGRDHANLGPILEGIHGVCRGRAN